MQYIERTRLVLEQVRQQPDLLKQIHHICDEHFHGDMQVLEDEGLVSGKGSTRLVYDVGTLQIPDTGTLNLLLKVGKEPRFNEEFAIAAGRHAFIHKNNGTSQREQLGAFEVYYSFAAGFLAEISYKNKEAYAKFCKEAEDQPYVRWAAKPLFRLDAHDWEGTRIDVGDVGAVPFFHMAVRYGKWFACLTEGLPALIEPRGTARSDDGVDEKTVEYSRIIDLGSDHSLLIRLNGEYSLKTHTHGDFLGLIARGEKYFDPENCLELDQ